MFDDLIGKFVVVRTNTAGVHCGILLQIQGTCARIGNSRCIWRWRGANSLNEVAINGVDNSFSRIAEPVEEAIFTEAIEIIPATAKARANLEISRWPS